jgi:hypothetical protein
VGKYYFFWPCYNNKDILKAYMAYRILLTVLVTVAYVERSFSKLKLIKSFHLRSTMSQERLNGLTILSIEKRMLENLKCKNLISNFAFQ